MGSDIYLMNVLKQRLKMRGRGNNLEERLFTILGMGFDMK